jgi:hypothetical protein
LDKGKGYELNVKPVNILSSTGRVEDDVLKRPFCSLLPYTNLVAHAKKVARRFVFYPAIPLVKKAAWYRLSLDKMLKR